MYVPENAQGWQLALPKDTKDFSNLLASSVQADHAPNGVKNKQARLGAAANTTFPAVLPKLNDRVQHPTGKLCM